MWVGTLAMGPRHGQRLLTVLVAGAQASEGPTDVFWALGPCQALAGVGEVKERNLRCLGFSWGCNSRRNFWNVSLPCVLRGLRPLSSCFVLRSNLIINRVLPGIDWTLLGTVRGHEDGVVIHVCHCKKPRVSLALWHPLAIQS